jgi:hypothetical protein
VWLEGLFWICYGNYHFHLIKTVFVRDVEVVECSSQTYVDLEFHSDPFAKCVYVSYRR